MSYAVMAHITDYDVWHDTEEQVSVEAVIRVLLRNAGVAKQSVTNAIRRLADAGPSPYADALENAIITDKRHVPAQTLRQLDLLVRKYFPD
jgi:5'-methylthioadenosine phosphorylase